MLGMIIATVCLICYFLLLAFHDKILNRVSQQYHNIAVIVILFSAAGVLVGAIYGYVYGASSLWF